MKLRYLTFITCDVNLSENAINALQINDKLLKTDCAMYVLEYGGFQLQQYI